MQPPPEPPAPELQEPPSPAPELQESPSPAAEPAPAPPPQPPAAEEPAPPQPPVEDPSPSLRERQRLAASESIRAQAPSEYATALIAEVETKISEALRPAEKEETRTLLGALGQGGFKLTAEQTRLIVDELLPILTACKLALLTKPPGFGKTATALATALAAVRGQTTPVIALVVGETIRAQFAGEISKMLPEDAYEVHHLHMRQMPHDSTQNLRTPIRDSEVWRCIHNQWTSGKKHFVFIPRSVFNESLAAVDIMLGSMCHHFAIADETHQMYRKEGKSAGQNLSAWIAVSHRRGVKTLFVSGTPVENKTEEAGTTLRIGDMHAPDGTPLRRKLFLDKRTLTDGENLLLLDAISSERRASDNAYPEVPNAYTLVLRVPDELPDDDDDGEPLSKRRRKGVHGTRKAQHGNGVDIETHIRYRYALALIQEAHAAQGQSVLFVADAVAELRSFKKLLQREKGPDGSDMRVHVVVGNATDYEDQGLRADIEAQHALVILATPAMCCGFDWSFLGLIIVSAPPPCVLDLQQIVFRKTRPGQKRPTYSIVMYQAIDQRTLELMQSKCDVYDAYYRQDPTTAVPALAHLIACPEDRVTGLLQDLNSALPDLTGEASCVRLCKQLQHVALWKRVSHLHAEEDH
jgi:hypothetical protein